MLMLPPAVLIFLALRPVDLRRSFDGLAALVRDVLAKNPLSGHVFVFRNKRGDRMKILFWDRSGFWLFYKRLERGVFVFPERADGPAIEIDSGSLALILEGVDLATVKKRPPIEVGARPPDFR